MKITAFQTKTTNPFVKTAFLQNPIKEAMPFKKGLSNDSIHFRASKDTRPVKSINEFKPTENYEVKIPDNVIVNVDENNYAKKGLKLTVGNNVKFISNFSPTEKFEIKGLHAGDYFHSDIPILVFGGDEDVFKSVIMGNNVTLGKKFTTHQTARFGDNLTVKGSFYSFRDLVVGNKASFEDVYAKHFFLSGEKLKAKSLQMGGGKLGKNATIRDTLLINKKNITIAENPSLKEVIFHGDEIKLVGKINSLKTIRFINDNNVIPDKMVKLILNSLKIPGNIKIVLSKIGQFVIETPDCNNDILRKFKFLNDSQPKNLIIPKAAIQKTRLFRLFI